MALTINRLGMSLIRMGKTADSVRFLDDIDLTFSLDSRSSSSQQMTSIEIASKPIVFRASYRDINLITAIVNKAIELSNRQYNGSPSEQAVPNSTSGKSLDMRMTRRSSSRGGSKSLTQPVGKARILTSKEQVTHAFSFIDCAQLCLLSA